MQMRERNGHIDVTRHGLTSDGNDALRITTGIASAPWEIEAVVLTGDSVSKRVIRVDIQTDVCTQRSQLDKSVSYQDSSEERHVLL